MSDRYGKIKDERYYNLLLQLGMFFEFHPELTGNWELDSEVINPTGNKQSEMSEKQDKIGQLTYEQFLNFSKLAKSIEAKQRSLKGALELIDPEGEYFIGLFNKELDDLVRLVDSLLGFVDDEWFSWFVYENEFGDRGHECGFKDEYYPICDERDMFEFLKLVD